MSYCGALLSVHPHSQPLDNPFSCSIDSIWFQYQRSLYQRFQYQRSQYPSIRGSSIRGSSIVGSRIRSSMTSEIAEYIYSFAYPTHVQRHCMGWIMPFKGSLNEKTPDAMSWTSEPSCSSDHKYLAPCPFHCFLFTGQSALGTFGGQAKHKSLSQRGRLLTT